MSRYNVTSTLTLTTERLNTVLEVGLHCVVPKSIHQALVFKQAFNLFVKKHTTN
jgi:hypothetical protein